MANPARKGYNQIIELSEKTGSHIFDSASANSSATKLPAEEAAAVAKAVGVGLQPSPIEQGVNKLSLSREASPLGKSFEDDDQDDNDQDDNDQDDNDDRATSPATTDSKEPIGSDSAVVLKSPTQGDDESPALSEEDDGNDSGDEMDDEEHEAVTPPVSKKEDGTYTAA